MLFWKIYIYAQELYFYCRIEIYLGFVDQASPRVLLYELNFSM